MIQWFLKCDTDKNLQGPRMYLCAKFDLLRLEEFADKETEILYAVVSFDPVCLKNEEFIYILLFLPLDVNLYVIS